LKNGFSISIHKDIIHLCVIKINRVSKVAQGAGQPCGILNDPVMSPNLKKGSIRRRKQRARRIQNMPWLRSTRGGDLVYFLKGRIQQGTRHKNTLKFKVLHPHGMVDRKYVLRTHDKRPDF